MSDFTTASFHSAAASVFKKINLLFHCQAKIMVFIALLFVVAFHHSQTNGDFRGRALYRNYQGLLAFGNFKRDYSRQLLAIRISSSFVRDEFECTFGCIAEANCNSFNMAAYPDSKGLYLCELLAADKYRAKKSDFQENVTFHHYSPSVRRIFNIFIFLVIYK